MHIKSFQMRSPVIVMCGNNKGWRSSSLSGNGSTSGSNAARMAHLCVLCGERRLQRSVMFILNHFEYCRTSILKQVSSQLEKERYTYVLLGSVWFCTITLSTEAFGPDQQSNWKNVAFAKAICEENRQVSIWPLLC